MTWTKTTPDKTGKYYNRSDGQETPRVFRLHKLDGSMWVEWPSEGALSPFEPEAYGEFWAPVPA